MRAIKREQTQVRKAEKLAQKESNPVTQQQVNPNLIKTSNKLIGSIINNDLYNSDDEGFNGGNGDQDVDMQIQSAGNNMYRNEELDLGTAKPKEGGQKKMDFLLKKI
jgi:hypothetical protein